MVNNPLIRPAISLWGVGIGGLGPLRFPSWDLKTGGLKIQTNPATNRVIHPSIGESNDS